MLDHNSLNGAKKEVVLMVDTIDAFVQYRAELMQHAPQELSHVGRDQHALVVENLRLVIPIALRYAASSTLPLLDLIQEGNLGLMRAAQDYDPTNSSFSNYATWWIKAFIRLALSRDSTSVTVPVEKAQRVQKIRRYLHDHPDTSLSELADAMELAMDEAVALLALAHGVTSLNTPVLGDDEEATLADFLEADPDSSNPEQIVFATHHPEIEKLFSHLLSLEQKVIRLRYGFGGKKPATHEEMARALGINRERVRSVEERAMMKLQRAARLSHRQESSA